MAEHGGPVGKVPGEGVITAHAGEMGTDMSMSILPARKQRGLKQVNKSVFVTRLPSPAAGN